MTTTAQDPPAVAGGSGLTALSASELHRRVESGEVTVPEVVTAFAAEITSTDPGLSAIVSLDLDAALDSAHELQARIDAGEPGGPLRGVVFGAKDLYDVAGQVTGNGSRAAIGDPVAEEDSHAVAALRAADGILLAKTTTHEYAMGATTPQTGNPHDPAKTPGGSSGGSGAAVGAGMLPLALGTDTGGSIRIPAAVCGVAGFKGTFGSVNTSGITSLSWSLDHAGPLARSVEDCAVSWSVMSGRPLSSPGDAYRLPEADLSDMTIALCPAYFEAGLDPAAAENFRASVERIRDAGATVVEIELPGLEVANDVLSVICSVEAASFHAERIAAKPDDYGEDNVDNIRRGFLYSGVDYVNAQRARRALCAEFATAMQGVDALVTPTERIAVPARDASSITVDGRDLAPLQALNINTLPANVYGAPALTVPNGYDSAGIPTSLQVMGLPGEDVTVLSLGAACEAFD
ncbi:amidase [Brevibacterium litoralis]|uniref:amidase n=1 Tax=Brevibacterium litoralis TaxID=3138935 RepID=UPI0032F03C0C